MFWATGNMVRKTGSYCCLSCYIHSLFLFPPQQKTSHHAKEYWAPSFTNFFFYIVLRLQPDGEIWAVVSFEYLSLNEKKNVVTEIETAWIFFAFPKHLTTNNHLLLSCSSRLGCDSVKSGRRAKWVVWRSREVNICTERGRFMRKLLLFERAIT